MNQLKKNETDPFSYFLLGQTYLFGAGEFSSVIDLSAAIEALKNAAKYITPDAKAHAEARPIAAEIWFYAGLACQTKANDDLHNGNKTDYEKYLNEAKNAYGRSWDYSQNMLESLYNLARGKALTNDEAGAIQDLKKVILIDHGYCIKTFAESDFSNSLKDKLFSQLKKELYPKVKGSFDQINSIKSEFQSPYSKDLTSLINKHLPKTFTEDTPPFDMLEATIYFPKILSVLESEQNAYIEKCKEQEQQEKKDREEHKRWEKEWEDRIERERRAEEQRKRQKIKNKKKKRNGIILWTAIGMAVGAGIGYGLSLVGLYAFDEDIIWPYVLLFIGLPVLCIILCIILFDKLYIFEHYIITGLIVGVLIPILLVILVNLPIIFVGVIAIVFGIIGALIGKRKYRYL